MTDHTVTDSKTTTGDTGLHALVAGAGIGGLTAAIALRQQGHQVTIFEQSQFANEAGAAIHLAPNANGLLRRLGLFAEEIGANDCCGVTEYAPSGELRYSRDTSQMGAMWQHPWHLVHRVHLHNTLKEHATRTEGPGKPAELRLRSRIVHVDAASATVKLATGEEVKGDLVIGADGVGSNCRRFVEGGAVKPFDSGKSAFRFLIEKKKLLAHPEIKKYIDKDGFLVMWIGNDKRLVMYPCAHNTLLNFVAIHPSAESDASGEEWNEGGNKSTLLKVFKDFHPDVLTILSVVDPSTLKVWKLLDMSVLPTWISGKLALLGDAAHPFLPHQGQGGGQAIEDAAALAALLPLGTKPDDVVARVKLYEQCRKQRADRIQEYTRIAGRDADEVAKSDVKMDMMEYTGYNFGHDAWHSAAQALRKHLQTESKSYLRAPAAFGPFPGPRQDASGRPREGAHSGFSKVFVTFRTSRTVLDGFLAPGFSFASPATVAQATWTCNTLSNLDWLGGGGYSYLELRLHGVAYTKADGSKVVGSYVVLLFEDLTDPILSGREELGMPKLPCTIDIEHGKDSAVVRAGWRGTKFLELQLQGLEHATESNKDATKPATAPPQGPPAPPETGAMYQRYVPAVGRPGEADADYAVIIPYDSMSVQPKVEDEKTAKTAQVEYSEGSERDLPTLHHITERLAEMPFLGLVEAGVVTGKGVDSIRGAQRVEDN